MIFPKGTVAVWIIQSGAGNFPAIFKNLRGNWINPITLFRMTPAAAHGFPFSAESAKKFAAKPGECLERCDSVNAHGPACLDRHGRYPSGKVDHRPRVFYVVAGVLFFVLLYLRNRAGGA